MPILAAYRFNGGATDSSGNAYAATANVSYPSGQFGQCALYGSGGAEYFDAPTLSAMNTGNGEYAISQQNVPIAAAISGTYRIVDRWSSGVGGQEPIYFYYGGYQNDGYRVQVQNTVGTYFANTYSKTFVAGAKYHTILNVGGGNCDIWINGKKEQQLAYTGTAYKRTANYGIGNRTYSHTEGFYGSIDEHKLDDAKWSDAACKNEFARLNGFF
jgi:hypothetical protein